MSEAGLRGPLLASVSRSFYLSIRILPRKIQKPIALAYLLARASDTIADSADAPAPIRLRHLANFEEMIRTGELGALPELQREIRPGDAGERALIDQLQPCLAWLAKLEAFDRAEVTAVLHEIIRGQSLDLQRFADLDHITALATAADLDEYAYLVAGCVGEFWTRVCVHHIPQSARLPLDELSRLGRSFGQGLQLVNILRDLPSDLRNGRCYLPEDELLASGASAATILTDPASARSVFTRWLLKATTHLDDGFRYIQGMRSARLRVACFLPWYLGVRTLALLHKQPPLEVVAKVKVPRSTVRTALLLGLPIAVSNRPLRAIRERLRSATP